MQKRSVQQNATEATIKILSFTISNVDKKAVYKTNYGFIHNISLVII